jgi:hypothetical protein
MRNIKPIIFIKKINDKYKVIPLNKTTNTSGLTRHFPPAVKEWFSSIYTFNKNSIKNLSIADKNLIKLIKSYFNLHFNRTVLKSKPIATRFRRLAVNKIFVSKAELKHTNNKVIITLYVYNEERRILVRKIKRLEAILFPFSINSCSKELHNIISNKNKILSIEEKLNIIKNQEDNIPFIYWLYQLKSYIIEQIKLEKDNLFKNKQDKYIKERTLIIEKLNENLTKLVNITTICLHDPISYKYYENIYNNYMYKRHLEKEINIIAYYKLLLNLNKSKFENKFLSKLKPLISKLYNKEVEFNIVNLKTLYFNSDIFTEAIALKLKNRDNKLLRVLGSSLFLINLPKINRIKERYNKINIKEL